MYNPNEPRDDTGKWTSFEGSAAIREAASSKKGFTSAKTLQEAEERLRNMGIQEVDLKGLKPHEFNAVLEAFEEENNSMPVKLNKLTTYRSSGSFAKALYSDSNKHITINLSKLKIDEYKPIESYEQQLLNDEKSIDFIKTNYLGKSDYKQSTVYARMNAFENRMWELKQKIKNGETARAWSVSADFQDKGKSLKATIHHEIGHYRQRQIPDSNRFEFNKKLSVSEYGRINKDEYFAEAYAHYRMNGENGVPKDLIDIFKKIK